MRWSLRLSEFDFLIEHKPGTRIRHADALSRHVGVVLEDGLPSKEKIFAEQSKDHFCNVQKPKIRSSKGEYFLDDDGVMYKRSREHQHQLVVPKSLVQDIIKANHNSVYIGHPGMKRTFDLISLHYWWPGMLQSVERYVKSCDPCQRREENGICSPVRKYGGALGTFRGHPHGYYRPVCSHPALEQTFIDIHRYVFKIRGSLPDD
jgi:hypothetical protein